MMTVSINPSVARARRRLPSPFAPFLVAWRDRRLVVRLARQEIEARYRGSVLGLGWAVLMPLIMLGVYTYVFTVVFQARWNVGIGSYADFALILFAGLIVFQFFAECVTRAPSMLLENDSYIKKVIFPLEGLAWRTALSAMANAGIGFAILLAARTLLVGPPPWTVLLLPIVLLPTLAMALGFIWMLSAVGVFLRDIQQAIGPAVTALMFLSPIFYPVEALPDGIRAWLYLNPLAFAIEQVRAITVFGQAPSWPGLAVYSLTAWAVAWLGFASFTRLRKGFADVV